MPSTEYSPNSLLCGIVRERTRFLQILLTTTTKISLKIDVDLSVHISSHEMVNKFLCALDYRKRMDRVDVSDKEC